MLKQFFIFLYHTYAAFIIYMKHHDDESFDNLFITDATSEHEESSHLQGGVFNLEIEAGS